MIAATPSVVNGGDRRHPAEEPPGDRRLPRVRLDVPSDDLVPTMLAAAVGGVIQAAQTQWFLHGGDLAARISEGLEVLERGSVPIPRTWSGRTKRPRSAGRTKPGNRRPHA